MDKTHISKTFAFLPPLLVNLIPGIGAQRYWSLVNALGSPEEVLASSPAIIPFIDDQGRALIRDYQKLGERSQLMQMAQQVIDEVDEHQGSIIHIDSPYYPELLKQIYHPPPLLYSKGNLDNLSLPQLALVGSRHPTHEGLQNARLFTSHLVSCGFAITSGLALGIDSCAHQVALDSGGKTIAVMATGIDDVYPKRHRYLAHKLLAEGGTLITEFTPHTAPKANHFPRRNRIISGLSLGVLVIEAAIKSGSLITANYALEQGREVFTIPGSIHNPQSKGCHQLIKDGASLVETSEDIVRHLDGLLGHIQPSNSDENTGSTTGSSDHCSQERDMSGLSPEQRMIIEHIGFKPTTTNELMTSTLLNSQQINTLLAQLEIDGWIKLSRWGYERV